MPRIMPTPNGVVNDRGLDFYERIVDALLKSGIKPVVTLYHWDLPQYLGDEGGWLNRKTAYALADYTSVVANRLGDRVDTWTTLNEPWCSSYLSYGAKEHAPGLGLGPGAFPAVHHLNLAHGLMVQAVRAELGESAKCSVTLNLALNRGDADACHRLDLISNRAFLDPMLRGRYPDELFAITKASAIGVSCSRAILSRFISRSTCSASTITLRICWPWATARSSHSPRRLPRLLARPTSTGCDGGPHTDMGWNIDPDGLHDLLVRVHDNYPEVPLMVTENGMACKDQLVVNNDGDKAVHDADRIDYLQRHLAAARRAMSEGVPLTGYFVWSLLDNFEWYFGYAKRFGITYVDYATQERIPKDSFLWYRDFIASRS